MVQLPFLFFFFFTFSRRRCLYFTLTCSLHSSSATTSKLYASRASFSIISAASFLFKGVQNEIFLF
jgi:hypothetical protein